MSVVAGARKWLQHSRAMFSASELLSLLRGKGVTNATIARVLELPSSRVAELYNGKRRLQLDEAKRLVEEFQLSETPLNPLSEPVARLLAIWAVRKLGAAIDPADARVEDLAQDLRVFSEFVTDPQVRENPDAVQGFFRALELARG
jgi:hypothetical protein